MAITNRPGPVFVVTDITYDVLGRSYVAHLRQVSPYADVNQRPVPLSDLSESTFEVGSFPRLGLTILVAMALEGRPSPFGAIFHTRTDFKAYQFSPLILYLKSGLNRILIADEVGLGKTIEACYILIEELARSDLKRILVLSPSALRQKWKDELWRRFGLNFMIMSGGRLKRALNSTDEFRAIASIDLLRQSDSQHLVIKDSVDFLVIDEIHHLIGRNRETLRRRLGSELSSRSSRVIALSATPIQIELDDLRRVIEIVLAEGMTSARFDESIGIVRRLNNLLRIPRPEKVSVRRRVQLVDEIRSIIARRPQTDETRKLDEVCSKIIQTRDNADIPSLLFELNPFRTFIIRNRKKDAGELRRRQISSHPVTLSERFTEGDQNGVAVRVSERSLFEEIDSLLVESFTPVHRRQLASCLPAMVDLLLSGMEGFRVWRHDHRTISKSELIDLDDSQSATETRRTLTSAERERCKKLADEYGLLDKDTKWDCLGSILEKLREPPAKAIVFTQWVPTLKYLARRASILRGLHTFAVSGEDGEWHIENTLEEFKNCPPPAVLFTTDLLSEGLDLQYANTLVNYDYPYNPQKVEQRIGRVDRVGQKSETIYVHNLWIRDSLDERILDLLDQRLNVFQQGMGDEANLFRVEVDASGNPKLLGRNRVSPDKLADINEASMFQGAGEFLDYDLSLLREKTLGNLDRFVWLLISRAFNLASAGQAKIVEETDSSLKIGPINDQDLAVLSQWVGINDSAAVNAELLSHRDDSRFIRIAKLRRGDGIYFTPTHPLARAGLSVTLNSTKRYTSATTPLLLQIALECESHWGDAVVICKFSLQTSKSKFQRLAYWGKTAETHWILKGQPLASFQDALETVVLNRSSRPESLDIGLNLRQEVAQHAVEWAATVENPFTGQASMGRQLDFIISDINANITEIVLSSSTRLKINFLAVVETKRKKVQGLA